MKIHSTTLQTRATITTTDKSNAVTIATWMTLVVFVLVFLAREGIKFTMVRKVGLDDVLILLATIFGVGLSVTILILASEGLGVLGPLTVRRADILMKAYYASDFLYISSIGLAKISVIGFFYGIHYRRTQLRFVAAFGIFILGWTIASILVIAFQCGLPRPWDVFTLHCYNKNIFWIVFCIIDMTSDVSIIMLSVNLVAYLKVRLSSKIAVVSCFAPRILVIGASLARLIYIYPVTPHDNPAFNLWTPIICGQVQVCLSIITACIPYMRPFFDLTDSSMWRGDGTRKRVTIDDGSFVNLPTSQVRGHRKFGFGQSMDSTAMASTKTGRTPDVSPRIPSPPPLSPLTTPRVLTPVNTPASIVRNPSNRGLRLHIPSIHIDRATEVSTPQTASSHALSPGCISPNPLLAPSPLSLSHPTPAPPPRAHSHQPVTSGLPGSPVAKTQNQPRFSLFPQPRPRFSLTPQAYTQPMALLATTRHSRSRSSSRTAVQHMSPNVTPETRTPSPNPLNPQYPPRTSSFQTVAYDDPLRSKAVVIAATAAASAPIPAVHYAHNSTPSYYVQTPPTQASAFSTPRTMLSYNTGTPPIAPLSRFSPQVSNQYPIEPIAPLAPANSRRRNQRILTPQNSSRSFQMAHNSPVSPPTPLTFWREDDTSDEQETQTAQGVWQSRATHSMPALKDARSSPQIVVQQFP